MLTSVAVVTASELMTKGQGWRNIPGPVFGFASGALVMLAVTVWTHSGTNGFPNPKSKI